MASGWGEAVPYVYADVFLALNLLADAAVLYAAGRLAGVRVHGGRVLGSAAAGALYSFGYLFPELSSLYSPPAKLAASLALLALAYAPLPLPAFLRLAAWLYAVSACAAGLTAALAWMGADSMAAAWASGLPHVPWWLPAGVLASLVWVMGRLRERVRAPLMGPWHVPVVVAVGPRRVECTGLVDTGNLLRDPVSGRPVLVAELGAVLPLIPAGERGLYGAGSAPAGGAGGGEWARRFRLVPFGAVGNRRGLLPAFRADTVTVGAGGERRVWRGITVAVTAERLGGDGGYQALVPPALLGSSLHNGGKQAVLRAGAGTG